MVDKAIYLSKKKQGHAERPRLLIKSTQALLVFIFFISASLDE